MIRNWAGNVAFGSDQLVAPRSVDELREHVAAAEFVKALGSRHSFSQVADTGGLLVSTDELDIEVEVHDDIVVVPGGRRYSEVITTLADRGRAFPNLGSLPHISIAGASATGTHGSGSGNRCLAAGTVAVEFVDALGELVTVGEDRPDFPGSVLALGALGIVTRLWMRTRPAFDMHQRVWLDAPLETVFAHLDEIFDCAYSVSLFYLPGRDTVMDQIWIKSESGTVAPDGRRWGAHAATGPVHPIPGQDVAATSPQLGQRRPSHEILPHFRPSFTPSTGDELQSEYFVDRKHGAAAVEALVGLTLGDLVQVMEFRTVAADGLWLGTAGGRDSLALHLTWVPDQPAVHIACARVEAALAPFAPRPHWGKIFSMDPDQVRECYPQLPEFAALATRHDPHHKFGNAFLQRYVY